MKPIDEIIKTPPVYLHNFSSHFDVVKEFENIYMDKSEYEATECPHKNPEYWEEQKLSMALALDKYKDVNIKFASYGTDNYSGEAWVLFERNGKLFEVNASHCSCYGCEGQWEPSELNLDELKNRLRPDNEYFGKDTYSDNEFATELKVFLGMPS